MVPWGLFLSKPEPGAMSCGLYPQGVAPRAQLALSQEGVGEQPDMSTNKEQGRADPAETADDTDKLKQGVNRFAQYTAPAMLALLGSGGHNMAFAFNTNL